MDTEENKSLETAFTLLEVAVHSNQPAEAEQDMKLTQAIEAIILANKTRLERVINQAVKEQDQRWRMINLS